CDSRKGRRAWMGRSRTSMRCWTSSHPSSEGRSRFRICPEHSPSTRVAKVVRDAGKQAAQTPDAMLHRELAQPQRRGRGHASNPRAAARELELEAVDLLEDEPAVELRDAVIIAALDPVGVREAEARGSAKAPLRPQDRENGIVCARCR